MEDEIDEQPLPSSEEMTQLLWAHADGTAERIIELLGGPLDTNNLSRFLEDEHCLRYPTGIQFTEEGLSEHQFAQPVFYTEGGGRRCMLHVHPRYESYPEAIPSLAAYMAATVMYGDVADAALCEHLGAMLVQQEREQFYEEICRLADWRP